MADAIDSDRIVGALLAGGAARRMGGGDKCLRTLGGETLLARTIRRLGTQVGRIILNANGDPERFGEYGLPVVADVIEGQAGPLAGVLTAMEWTRDHAPEADYVLTVPTDIPFLPLDLALRVSEALVQAEADIACVASGGREHPVPALWKIALAPKLRADMAAGARKVDGWTAGQKLARVEWSNEPVDPFFNVNREEDLERATALLAAEVE